MSEQHQQLPSRAWESIRERLLFSASDQGRTREANRQGPAVAGENPDLSQLRR